MFAHLGPTEVAFINRYVNRHCENPKAYGELQQLRQLFNLRFRSALERLLNRSIRRERRPAVCDVQLGWIDKIPIARSSSLKKGTELGDAVLFAFDERRDFTGKFQGGRARAAILQAKVARSVTQRQAPSVPIGTGSSSANELELLSKWPKFDLHETSGSKSSCLTNVTIAPQAAPPSEAWFMAAPGEVLSAPHKASWPCWWMAGQPHLNASCATTIGELLVGFLAPSPSRPNVGAPFTRQTAPSKSSSAAKSADWSDLCNDILRILEQHDAPPSLFGPSQPRIYSIPFWAQFFTYMYPAHHHWMADDAARWHRLRNFLYHRYQGFYSPTSKEERKGVFVLIVTVTRFGEG